MSQISVKEMSFLKMDRYQVVEEMKVASLWKNLKIGHEYYLLKKKVYLRYSMSNSVKNLHHIFLTVERFSIDTSCKMS